MPLFAPKFAQNDQVPGANEELLSGGGFDHLKAILQGFIHSVLDTLRMVVQEGIRDIASAAKEFVIHNISFVFHMFLFMTKKIVLLGDSLAASLATLIAQILEYFPGSFGS